MLPVDRAREIFLDSVDLSTLRGRAGLARDRNTPNVARIIKARTIRMMTPYSTLRGP